MSELIHTRCDGCVAILNVDPGLAVDAHGWMEDDYGNHFCIACQQSAEDLEAQTPTPEETEKFVDAVNAEAAKVLPMKRRK